MAAVNKYNPSAFVKVMSSATMAGTKNFVIPRYTIVFAFYKYLKNKIFLKFKNEIFCLYMSVQQRKISMWTAKFTEGFSL